MNTPLRVVLAAAAVVAIAVVGIRLLPSQDSGIGSVPTPTPIPTSSPTPTAMTYHSGPLEPGTYSTQPYAPKDTMRLTFTIPAGWEGAGGTRGNPSDTGSGAPSGSGFAVLDVGDLYSDPCNGAAGDISTGTSVDELVSALVATSAAEASAPTATTVGGFSGQRIDLQLPSDVDFSACKNSGGDPEAKAAGLGGYFIWESAEPGGVNIYAQGPGNRFHLWILDVNGFRAVIFTQGFAGTSAADQAALQAIVDSIGIEP